MLKQTRGKVLLCGIEDPSTESPLKIVIHGPNGRDIEQDYLDQLNIELQTLLLTRRGTLPGSRGYGMLGNFLDYATPESVNQLAVELDAAVQIWIPDVRLIGVYLDADELGAADVITLELTLREEYV